ncbi:heme NO-binding domain-containing protein [Pontibacter sp. CAU 1760]
MKEVDMQEDTMHGSIFVFLKRFVESSYDYSTWTKIMESTGIHRTGYQMQELYPTHELVKIVGAVSALSGMSAHEVQESFGKFLVPDLLMIYKKYINPSWRTFDMILHSEQYMHGAVRKQDDRSTPPRLSVDKVSSKLLVIDYYSKRRMASVALGIVKGIALYFNESDQVTVRTVTPLDAERVQLRVEFA